MGGLFSRVSSHVLNQIVQAVPENVEEDGSFEKEYGDKLIEVLEEVQAYKAHEEEHQIAIRNAMISESDPERMASALESLKPAVQKIMKWYDVSEVLSIQLPGLLECTEETLRKVPVSQGGNDDSTALRALIGTLHLIMKIDTFKLSTPGIQNDFSFVRRAASRHATLVANIVDLNSASAASMFIAQSSPFLARLSMNLSPENVKRLGLFASVLANVILTNQRGAIPSDDVKKIQVCLGAMTASFILYDRGSSTSGGGFISSSPVSAKRVVLAITKKATIPYRQHLLGAFRYTTVNYAEYASSAVQSLVDNYA